MVERMDFDLNRALDVAQRAATAATKAALPFFIDGVPVERKADRTPVTEADRAAEKAILAVITETYPDHSILAEESGAKAGDPRFRWIIDPIDGTRGFTRGGSFWGSLIALEVDGEIVVGTMGLPALGDLYYAARGRGCFVNDTQLRIGDRGPDLTEATLSLGEMRPLLRSPWDTTVLELVQQAASARCYGDLMGVALVLQGVADAWLEAGVAPWDIAPAKVLVEEAGGVFTNFLGDQDLAHGTALASTPSLHPVILERLKQSA